MHGPADRGLLCAALLRWFSSRLLTLFYHTSHRDTCACRAHRDLISFKACCFRRRRRSSSKMAEGSTFGFFISGNLAGPSESVNHAGCQNITHHIWVCWFELMAAEWRRWEWSHFSSFLGFLLIRTEHSQRGQSENNATGSTEIHGAISHIKGTLLVWFFLPLTRSDIISQSRWLHYFYPGQPPDSF